VDRNRHGDGRHGQKGKREEPQVQHAAGFVPRNFFFFFSSPVLMGSFSVGTVVTILAQPREGWLIVVIDIVMVDVVVDVVIVKFEFKFVIIVVVIIVVITVGVVVMTINTGMVRHAVDAIDYHGSGFMMISCWWLTLGLPMW
jgi:hypothetical protein